MVWRVLGVAVVLLGVGVVGGYAVASRASDQPVVAGDPVPVAAVSPDVPTPPAVTMEPDPTVAPIEPGLSLVPQTVRAGRTNGFALDVGVPDGWVRNPQPGGGTWNYVPPDAYTYGYKLRVGIVAGQHAATSVLLAGRLAGYQSAIDNDTLSQFQLLDQDADGFEATYIDHGHLRFTAERWVTLGDDTAYAVAAVTGRTVDRDGLTDLLDAVTASMAKG